LELVVRSVFRVIAIVGRIPPRDRVSVAINALLQTNFKINMFRAFE